MTTTELTKSVSWKKLLSALGDPFAVSEAHRFLLDLREQLITCGVTPDVLHENINAMHTNSWEAFISLYGQDVGAKTAFLCALLRPREKAQATPGLVLLSRDEISEQNILRRGPQILKMIGEHLLGSPLSEHDRRIEFYDVVADAGGFHDPDDPPITLFTPFNIGGWTPSPKMLVTRRTQMLVSIVLHRFRTLTWPLTAALVRTTAATDTASFLESDENLRQVISVWLYLHEIMHLNGPIPLFGTGKIALGQHYAPVEEFRVDASIWLGIWMMRHTLGSLGEAILLLILAERVVRSCFCPVDLPKASIKSETTHGQMWLGCLLQSGAASITANGHMMIDLEAAAASLTRILGHLYESEDAVAGKQSSEEALKNLASRILHYCLEPLNANAALDLLRQTVSREKRGPSSSG